MNPNIAHIHRPPGAVNNPKVDAALAALDRDVTRFFDAGNGPRPIYVKVIWRGRYYVARARYAVTGGQHMTISSRIA